MRKLTLDVNALSVESFEAVSGRAPGEGTVHGHDSEAGEETCGGKVTYCMNTCWCPNTSPQPSCDECSWMECPTYDVNCA